MWPVHCVENTIGADFHQDIEVLETDHIIKKGTMEGIESYSAFGKLPEDTGLSDLLKKNSIKKVFVVGLAYDYCVGNTAIDAA
jgi:nicotinamidase/pyrazinamidase